MNRRAPGVFWTYLILQVPDIVLAGLVLAVLYRWAGLPYAWAVGAFVAWVAKDIAMYPVVRSAFLPARTGAEAFIGARGVAADALAPLGYVRLDGELWRAESVPHRQAIPAGTTVVVRAVQGLTFLVEAEAPVVRPPDRRAQTVEGGSGGGQTTQYPGGR